MFYRRYIASCMILFLIQITLVSSFSLSASLNIYNQKETISYATKEQNLTKLQPGDIAFKHPDIFPDIFPAIVDHSLLYVGYNNSTDIYIFIEASAVDDQVKYRFETESTLTGLFYGPFARVRHANTTQKQNAIDFVKKQVGKPFQGQWINKNYNPEDTINDSLADEWYCSELVWAAYYNCNNPFPEEEPENGYVYGEGIDLDRNGWKENFLNYTIVRPREILRNRFEVSVYHLKGQTSTYSIITF